jgi:hypothetical protein
MSNISATNKLSLNTVKQKITEQREHENQGLVDAEQQYRISTGGDFAVIGNRALGFVHAFTGENRESRATVLLLKLLEMDAAGRNMLQ